MNSLRFFKNRLILSLPPQDSTSPVPPQFFTEEPQPCPAPRKTLVLPTYPHSIPRGRDRAFWLQKFHPAKLYFYIQTTSLGVALLSCFSPPLPPWEQCGHQSPPDTCCWRSAPSHRRDQILPLPFGARKMQRRGEGEGDKVPVRAPLTSSWLSKRQQLIAGVAGWGGET